MVTTVYQQFQKMYVAPSVLLLLLFFSTVEATTCLFLWLKTLHTACV